MKDEDTCAFQVNRFCRQQLQLEQQLSFPDGRYLREQNVQETIFHALWDPQTRQHPGPPRYQLKTLKKLVAEIEKSIEDWDEHGLDDGLMESLSDLLSQPIPPELVAAQQKAYVTYSVSALAGCPTITLLESRAIISARGTTGLATWEAALHLGQYLCSQPETVQQKHVLELGAGTGYLSILCARYLEAQSVLASDGSDDVVNNLPESFFLNHLQDSHDISAKELKWGHALLGTEEPQWNGGRPVDVVLGADITYDDSVIPLLIATLTELAEMFPHVSILVAATERNQATFQTFMSTASKSRFAVQEIDFPLTPRALQTGPFYSDAVPIHICQLQYGRSPETLY